MLLKRFSALLVAILFSHSLLSQDKPVFSKKESDKYASEPYVVRSAVSCTSMNADGTGTREQEFVIQLQSEASVHLFSVVSTNFAKASETAEFVYARVRRPDGTVVQTPVESAQELPLPVTREAPSFSDLITKQLPLRSLHVGDTLEWKIRTTDFKAEVPGQFYSQQVFFKGAVVLSETNELRVPAGIHVTVWTNPKTGGKALESEVDGKHVWTWQHQELEPTVGAAAEERKRTEEKRIITPEEELDSTKGSLPSIAWTTFSDWTAVGAWYRDLIAGQSAPDDTVRAKVAEVTAGKTSQLEKSQAIYYYVSSQIHYVAVSFGVGRLKPHTAAEVLANQYGDCKDKHTLLASMLSVIGIETEPVLIGVGQRLNSRVPSPDAFNHLISHLVIHGETVWLDTTNEVAAWGTLLAGIRDQDALVIPVRAPSSLLHTPANLPYAASTAVTVISTLNDQLVSESQMTWTFHDDVELALRLALRNVPASDYGETVQRLMANFGFGGTTSDASFEHLNDASQPLRMKFHYHRDKEESWGDNRVTIPFAPQFLPYFTVEKPPVSSIQLEGPRTLVTTVEEALPSGWSATLPEAEHEDTAFASSSTSYRLEGNKLLAERRLTILQAKLPIVEAKRYREWYDRASIGSVPYLQLLPPEKKVGTITIKRVEPDGNSSAQRAIAADSSTAGTPTDSKTAEQLVEEAGSLISNFDHVAARKLLDRAKAMNSRAEGLWMGYAALDAQNGQGEAAVGDLRLELQYHPDEVKVYNYLSMQQAANGKLDDSLATLKEWQDQFPLDRDAALYLVGKLERMKRYKQALDEANNALKRLASSAEDLGPLRTAAARLSKEAALEPEGKLNGELQVK